MSRMSVLRSGASMCRAVLGRRRAPKKLFAPFPAEGAKAASTLAGPVTADNVLSSPFGTVDIPTQPLAEYVFDGYEAWADSPAIVCGSTGRSYTYSMCQMMIKRFSKALLAKLKLQPGDTVGLILPNIPEFLIVIFGAMEAGLRVTCANPLYTPDELSRQFTNCDVNLVITIDMFMPKVHVIKNNLSCYKGTVVISETSKSENDVFNLKDLLAKDYKVNMPFIDIDSVALIPYSSGTTGLPKGVLLTHKNLVTNIMQFGTDVFRQYKSDKNNGGTTLTVPPFFHIYGFNGVLNYNLRVGRRIVTIPRFTPEDYIKCLLEYRPKTLFVVPSLLTFLSNHPSVTKEHLSSIEDVMIGAAPVTESTLEHFLLKCGKTRDQIALQQGFGMSESSPVTLLTPYRFPASKTTSAGQIIPGTECRVVSIATGENVGPNTPGELWCRGPQVMQGYLKNEEATKETIDEDGWLHTGDVAYYDEDHFFYIVDRTKELIKVKGNQVSPTELENLLLENCSIADAAVVGVPDHLAGELPRAFVVLKEGKEISEKEIYDQIAQKVVKYKRLDGGVIFIDSIPRNPGGKIMRNELKVLGTSLMRSFKTAE